MKSIKSKIIVFSILATLIPSFGLGMLSFQQNETMISENVTRELRALAHYASRELDLWTKEQVLVARELATSKMLIDGLSVEKRLQKNKRQVQQQPLALYLKSVQKRLDTVLELTVVDANGKFIASNADVPVFTALASDWVEQASILGELVLAPQWNTHYATAILSISVPILSGDDFVLGALIVTFNIRSVQSNLKDKVRSPPGDVLLLDQQGYVMLTSDISIPDGHPPMALSMDVIQKLLANPGEYEIFPNPLQEKTAGLAYMSETPVTIIANRSYRSIYDAWEYQRNLFIWLICFILLMVTSIAFHMSHTIAVALQKLIGATQRIVKGDLNITLTNMQHDEIGQLTRTFNQMTEQLRQNQIEISAASSAMQQKNQQLELLSVTDGLTGLYNRNKLNAIINDQLARYERNKRPFGVLMIDIDHFKTLNDGLGHVAGDEVIVAVAQKISQSIRAIDFAARYGGDEFVVILAESVIDETVKTAERIREQVAAIHCGDEDNNFRVTLSIGAIQSEPQDTSLTILLSRVDGALYEAKRAGRDQVVSIKPGWCTI
ncbi:MAG: diguanylate cyclase [Nitrosomonas sp.]|nr:MAG: diguanylate cyclase [Nitrosomonas sp.]